MKKIMMMILMVMITSMFFVTVSNAASCEAYAEFAKDTLNARLTGLITKQENLTEMQEYRDIFTKGEYKILVKIIHKAFNFNVDNYSSPGDAFSSKIKVQCYTNLL